MIVSTTLTSNPTWTPRNQVSYLKGSSMDSFTLRLLPKIDFNKQAQQQHNGNNLRANGSVQYIPKIYYLSSKEFNIEFCKLYMPRGLYL
jgi:hypothetical protein